MLCVLTTLGPAVHAAALDAEQLFKPAEVSHVSISPDGQHVAMVRGGERRDTLILFKRPLAERSIVSGVESGNGERFAKITWANNTHVLIEAAADQLTTPQLNGAIYLLGTDGSKRRLLQRNAKALQLDTAIVSLLPGEPTNVLVAAHSLCAPETCTEAEATPRRLASIDLTSGELTTVAEPPPINAYFASNPQGTLIYAAGRTEDGIVEVYHLDGGVWSRIQQFDPAGDIGTVPYFIDGDGRTFGLANKVGTADLVEWDAQSGSSTALYRDAGSDVNGFIASYAGQRLLAVRSDSGFAQWHYIDAEHPFVGTHKAMRAAFPESDVEVVSFTADGTEAVAKVHSDRNPGAFYMVNTKTRETTLLATSRPWLKEDQLFTTQPLELLAGDTFMLRGFLTTPEGDGPHPTILWLQDNPASIPLQRSFNAAVQMFAQRGFAVLQINFRGAAGLGQAYRIPDRDEDARIIQRDIADAARWAIEQNISESGKVCIAGQGYGAFAAVKALTTSGDLFQCAAGIDGFYDLSAGLPKGNAKLLTPQSLFNLSPNLDLADAKRAPVNRAGNITASVLLVGDDEQTDAMASAMNDMEGSISVAASSTEFDNFQTVLAYLQTQLQGAPPPTEPAAASFGGSLSSQQRRAFQQLVGQMRNDVDRLDFGRAPSVSRVSRQVERIIDRYDDDVRKLVSDEQWRLYDEHKVLLKEQLMANLDIIQLR
jgi:dipeptidyl aminopeptidase/acylaminoacyl peptidase